MPIFDWIQSFPPFLQYLIYGTSIAILAFGMNALMPKRQARVFEPSLLVRYLAMGFIFGGAIYFIYHHREILHV